MKIGFNLLLWTGHVTDENFPVIEKLKANRGYIQRDLYKRVKLRSSPLLSFRLDRSAERGVRILNAIDNLPPEAPQSEPPPEGFYPEEPGSEEAGDDEGEAKEEE